MKKTQRENHVQRSGEFQLPGNRNFRLIKDSCFLLLFLPAKIEVSIRSESLEAELNSHLGHTSTPVCQCRLTKRVLTIMKSAGKFSKLFPKYPFKSVSFPTGRYNHHGGGALFFCKFLFRFVFNLTPPTHIVHSINILLFTIHIKKYFLKNEIQNVKKKMCATGTNRSSSSLLN